MMAGTMTEMWLEPPSGLSSRRLPDNKLGVDPEFRDDGTDSPPER